MKARLSILLILFSLTSYTQTIKHHSIYSGQGIMLSRYISFDDNKPIDTTFFLSCRDARYQTLVEYITIKKSSSLSEINAILLKSIELMNTEEIGTTVLFEGKSIYLSKLMGARFVSIEGETTGYASLYESQIKKLLSKIDDYERQRR